MPNRLTDSAGARATSATSPTDLPPLTESSGDVTIAAGITRGRTMPKRRRPAPEQVTSKLREAEVKTAEGTALARVCKDPAITEPTCDRWRKVYGGTKL